MAEKKEKRYVSDNAQLMAEWDWEKNNTLGLVPNEITSHSGKKVWWKCQKGHEWVTSVANRSKGNGCPYCSNKIVLKGLLVPTAKIKYKNPYTTQTKIKIVFSIKKSPYNFIENYDIIRGFMLFVNTGNF